MGFWIYYKIAVVDDKKSIRRLCRNINRCETFNELREWLGLNTGGMADMFTEPEINGNTLTFWASIRCNWMNAPDFCSALKDATSETAEVYFLIDERDLDPGNADEFQYITNDKDLKVFGDYKPIEFAS